MDQRSILSWEFGGPLAALSAPLAWAIVVVMAAIAFSIAWRSYRGAIRPLNAPDRHRLVALRVVGALLVLACLANPTRVITRTLEPEGRTGFAFVADVSESMTAPDHRGRSRLDDALSQWRALEPAARRDLGEPRLHALGRRLVPVDSLAALTGADPDRSGTALLTGLGELARSAGPTARAIVCLTDGIDTASPEPAAAEQSLLAAGVPLFFIAGENRVRPTLRLAIEEFVAPDQALQSTEIPVRAVIRVWAPEAGEVEIRLSDDGRERARGKVAVRAGFNRFPWSHRLEAGAEGWRLLRAEARFAGTTSEAAAWVRVVRSANVAALLYQGALDWGSVFLAQALRRGEDLQLDARVDPAAAGPRGRAGTASPLPSTSGELARFQVIVLAQVAASQLSGAQQAALIEFVRAGGGLLFLVSDTRTGLGFGGSELERMLPVVFGRPGPEPERDLVADRFRQTMDRIGGSDALMETEFAEATIERQERRRLMAFAVGEGPEASAIFGQPGAGPSARIRPHFAETARVDRAKPGARILAAHPNDPAQILLAVQPFGAGRSAVLATDSLWNWKMSMPSQSKEAEIFWQQLVLWLGSGPRAGTLRIAGAGSSVAVGAGAQLHVDAAETPKLWAETQGRRVELAAQPGERPGSWDATFRPETAGLWTVYGRAQGVEARRAFMVSADAIGDRERSGEPPDIEQLRKWAAATGGRLIDREVAAPWEVSDARAPLEISRRREPLWNGWWMLALILGLYCGELLLRRSRRMV